MNALEQSVGSDSKAGDRLTQIYIIMGRELETQLHSAGDDSKAKEAISDAFDEFLAGIAQGLYDAVVRFRDAPVATSAP